MVSIEKIPQETLINRGAYATVRGAHEDEKKNLQKICGQLSAIATQVLRKMQPDHDDAPDSVESLIESGRLLLDMMQACSERIESLAKQRQELKAKAWG